MMREILFRGKSAEDGEWRFGHHIKRPSFSDSYPRSYIYDPPKLAHELGQWEAVVPETVGQFTGLTANGKKIFEGDILKDEWGKVYKVIFTTKSCGFMAECTVAPNDYETGRYRIGDAWCNTIKVIGNIHDNPELLEGGAEDGK